MSLFTEAQQVIPGGVNSPVRSFNSVGGEPIFIKKADGAYVIDSNDKQYIDYVASWGPMILGHNNPIIKAAVIEAVNNGLSYGAPTVSETKLASKICELMPNIEQVRFVNSGTEACMSAIRLARGYTNRSKIIKFIGCYHGHSDCLLVQAGSGALTHGMPNSAGVPVSITQETLLANYNDLASVENLFKAYPNEIAGIIVEPVAGNMNFIPGNKAFLQGLRTLCDKYSSVLIFDEVMTGFRIALNGAQSYYDIAPDLTTLGKVIGGGLPVGAIGGKKKIMQYFAPTGPVYQAGTLSGNPVTMAAGLAALIELEKPGVFEKICRANNNLCIGLEKAAQENNIAFCTQHIGTMFGLYFTDKKTITNFNDAMSCDDKRFNKFFHAMLKQGVYFAPAAFESGFLTLAHDDAIIAATITAAQEAFKQLA